MTLSPFPGVHADRRRGQLCAIYGFDIAGWTDRDDGMQILLRARAYEMLHEAFDGCGVPWGVSEERGDGPLIAIPLSVPPATLVGPVPDQLACLLHQHNRLASTAGRIQLRAAAHIGMVYHDCHGLAGDDVILVCRMLDARPLRQALAADVDLAIMISPYMHDILIRPGPDQFDPGLFRPVRTRVKRMRIRGWLYQPGEFTPQGDWPP